MFTKNLAPPVKSAGNPFLPFTRFSDYENLQPPNAQNPRGRFCQNWQNNFRSREDFIFAPYFASNTLIPILVYLLQNRMKITNNSWLFETPYKGVYLQSLKRIRKDLPRERDLAKSDKKLFDPERIFSTNHTLQVTF